MLNSGASSVAVSSIVVSAVRCSRARSKAVRCQRRTRTGARPLWGPSSGRNWDWIACAHGFERAGWPASQAKPKAAGECDAAVAGAGAKRLRAVGGEQARRPRHPRL